MLRRLIAISPVLLIGCTSTQVQKPEMQPSETAIASPSPSVSPSNPNSAIGKTDQFGVVVKIDIPSFPECQRKYQSVEKDTFEKCLIEGLTFVQTSNIIGFAGDLSSKSGTYEVRQWSNGMKIITASFKDGYLISKSQVGLN